MSKVPVKIGVNVHHISLTYGAIEEIEERTGKGMMNGEVFTNLRLKDIAIMLWCGAKVNNSGLKLKQIKDSLEARDITKYTEALAQAFSDAIGAEEETLEEGED